MRKYRGKSKQTGEWVYGCYIYGNCVNNDTHYITLRAGVYHQVIPETVGQFTGLKDSKRTKEFPKGKEIFEGDIVSASIYGDETPQILKVYESKGAFVIDYEDSETDLTTVGWFVGSLEVIGTIHDPELPEAT